MEEEDDPRATSGIITDSAQTMVATQAILLAKYTWFIILFCLAHALNLMMQDIGKTPSCKGHVVRAKALIVAVRSPALCKMYMDTSVKVTPKKGLIQRYVSTRFSSALTALLSLVDNRERLQFMQPGVHKRLEKMRASLARKQARTVANGEAPASSETMLEDAVVDLQVKRQRTFRYLSACLARWCIA